MALPNSLSRSVIALLLSALAVGSMARAAEPPRNSPERKAILDVLRPVVEADIGPPVAFEVERINIEGEWAFVSATPRRPGGPVDWTRTKYAKQIATDAMSDSLLALLHKKSDGPWRLAEYDLGPTDVTWEEWIPKYRLPRSFFVQDEQAPVSNKPAESSPSSDRRAPANADDVSRALDEALGAPRRR